MAQIVVSDLTFYYDGSYDTIFDRVNFRIDTDWKLGFIGRNGRGKTTFLQLLLGNYEYKGSIQASVVFDYFPMQVSEEDYKRNTIDFIEHVYPEYELWMICREINLLEMEADLLYRPYGTLSNGEQTKVMLAILFAKENYFLLLDEPTNHLDHETRVLIRDYLSKKKGFILVSHDRWLLDACVDHILVINKNDISVEQGNFSSWYENKKRQDEFELAENVKLKKDIRRLSEAAKRAESWSEQTEKGKIGAHVFDRGFIGHKAEKMMKRARSMEARMDKAIEDKSQLLKNVETADQLKIIPLTHHKEVLVKLDQLTIYYDGRRITEPLDMEIRNGDRVILHGMNGCGKSSMIKKILGQDIVTTGTFTLASGLKISYVSQDTSHLKGILKDYAIEHHLNESLFKALLRKLDFERVQFDKRMEDFSGGQKKKVLIARSLCEQAHLYIWDEPLNFIDIFSRIQIEDLILEFKPTMLVVEHDQSFVERIATEKIEVMSAK